MLGRKNGIARFRMSATKLKIERNVKLKDVFVLTWISFFLLLMNCKRKKNSFCDNKLSGNVISI